jgi:hypothetical protein
MFHAGSHPSAAVALIFLGWPCKCSDVFLSSKFYLNSIKYNLIENPLNAIELAWFY